MRRGLDDLVVIFITMLLLLLAFPMAASADSWTQVASGGIDGTYNMKQYKVNAMTVFNGDMYCTTESEFDNGCLVWRYDGANWVKVSTVGFGDPLHCTMADSMAVVGSYLYVGCSGSGGCRIYRTQGAGGPPYTDWQQVNTSGFGSSNNYVVESMKEFGGYLYAGTYNNTTGCEIWRADDPGDPSDWEQVSAAGFDATANKGPSCMEVLGSDLYVGTYNASGCEIWRTDGTGSPTWEEVYTSGSGDVYEVQSMFTWNSYLHAGLTDGTTGCKVLRSDGTGAPLTWEACAPDGFGLGSSNYSVQSMLEFGSYLYASTGSGAGGRVYRTAAGAAPYTWALANTAGYGESANNTSVLVSYDSSIYAGTTLIFGSSAGSDVFRTDASSGPPHIWTQVNTEGFASDREIGAEAMASFNGDLYVGTGCNDRGSSYWSNHCQVWRRHEGTWSQVNADGFGHSHNLAVSSMLILDGYLYVGTYNTTDGCELYRTDGSEPLGWELVNSSGFGSSANKAAECMTTYTHGGVTYLYVGTSGNARIYRTTAGRAAPFGDWTLVNSAGFGNGNNNAVLSMCVYKKYLYAGTYNSSDGAMVYRTNGTGGPPYTWTVVNNYGFGEGNWDVGAFSMQVYRNYLYVGTDGTWHGCNIYRTDASGSPPFTWQRVTSRGFGDTGNRRVARMGVFDFQLYAFTAKEPGSPVGCEVWKSSASGGPPFTDWAQASTDGFGSKYNEQCLSALVDFYTLYVGTYNYYFGAEVWQTEATPHPAPTVASIHPNSGSPGGTVTVDDLQGTGFVDGAKVLLRKAGSVDIEADDVTVVNANQITCSIDLSVPQAVSGAWDVVVQNEDGQTGTLASGFNITNPVPTTTTLDPAEKTAGEGGFTLTVNGTNFVSDSVVRWGGSDRATAFVSGNQLTATILAGDIGSPGTVDVTVFNPAPGGGLSNAQTFTINNPVPVTTSMDTTNKTEGDAPFTLTVYGSNFVPSAVVRWDGSDRGTVFLSGSELRAAITAPDMASPGDIPVTVFNPAPGGGISNAQTFTIEPRVTNPVPTTTGISPTSKTAGEPDFELTVDGTGFVAGSVVRWNGFDRVTDVVSDTRCTATILASDIAIAGIAPVTVFNPAPGGGVSNAHTLTINPASPNITTLSTQFAPTGTTVTVTGTSFGHPQGTSYVRFGTFAPAPADYVSWSDTVIHVKVPAAAYFQTDVVVHTDAGGDSNAYLFYVQAYISTVSPTWGNAGVTYITLTGYGFGPTRGTNSVWFDGSKATTYTTWTNNSIRVQVGAGAQGQSHVKVMVMGCYSNAKAFDVRPLINSISPTSGPAGTTVTISGSSFCNSQGSGCVFFGSKQVTSVTSWRQTQIKVKVPTGISGTVQVKVYTTGGMSNGKSFTKI